MMRRCSTRTTKFISQPQKTKQKYFIQHFWVKNGVVGVVRYDFHRNFDQVLMLPTGPPLQELRLCLAWSFLDAEVYRRR